MRIFLIDFENVHSEGMAGVDLLGENDEVVIFYSVNADSLSFELLHKLMFCKAKLSYYKIKRGGRNALDFQLSTYLGYLVSARPDAEFYIISRDNGYDFTIDFWESGCLDVKPKVKRFTGIKPMLNNEARTLAPVPPVKTIQAVAATPVPAIPQIVEVRMELPVIETAAESDYEKEQEEIEKMLGEAESPHELYIRAVKRFGQKKGVEIYRSIKSRFSKIKVVKEEEK